MLQLNILFDVISFLVEDAHVSPQFFDSLLMNCQSVYYKILDWFLF